MCYYPARHQQTELLSGKKTIQKIPLKTASSVFFYTKKPSSSTGNHDSRPLGVKRKQFGVALEPQKCDDLHRKLVFVSYQWMHVSLLPNQVILVSKPNHIVSHQEMRALIANIFYHLIERPLRRAGQGNEWEFMCGIFRGKGLVKHSVQHENVNILHRTSGLWIVSPFPA